MTPSSSDITSASTSHYLGREGVRLTPKAVDTAGLARYLLPTLQRPWADGGRRRTRHRSCRHHRALNDARTAAAVFVALLRRAEALPEAQRFQLARFVSMHEPLLAEVIAGEEWDERSGGGHIPLAAPRAEREALELREPRAGRHRLEACEGIRRRSRSSNASNSAREQLEMAEAVRIRLPRGGHWLIEAGTGVGKSLAYLLPAALHAIKNGERVVVSTNTIALQEQLLSKDIPAFASCCSKPAPSRSRETSAPRSSRAARTTSACAAGSATTPPASVTPTSRGSAPPCSSGSARPRPATAPR